MFIKPFNNLLKEQSNPVKMSYLGFVEANDDPQKLGRIKVRITPYADLSTEAIPWASPILGTHGNSADSGGLNVPEVGSQVRINFPSEDFTAPYYSGAELNEVNRTTFFDEDYPFTYGYKDSIGDFIRINKERGTAQVQHFSTTNLQVSPDGSIKVGLAGGAYFVFDSGKSFDLNISTVDVQGTPDGTFAVTANNEVDLNTPQVNVSGSVDVKGDLSVGSGASGSFIAGANFVTVKKGIIVSIE